MGCCSSPSHAPLQMCFLCHGCNLAIAVFKCTDICVRRPPAFQTGVLHTHAHTVSWAWRQNRDQRSPFSRSSLFYRGSRQYFRLAPFVYNYLFGLGGRGPWDSLLQFLLAVISFLLHFNHASRN